MVTDGAPRLTYVDDYRPNNAFIAWSADKRLYFTLAGARDFGSDGFLGTPEFGMYSNLKNYLELYKYIAHRQLKPTFSTTELANKLAKVAKVYEQLRDDNYKPLDKEEYYDKNGNKILPFININERYDQYRPKNWDSIPEFKDKIVHNESILQPPTNQGVLFFDLVGISQKDFDDGSVKAISDALEIYNAQTTKLKEQESLDSNKLELQAYYARRSEFFQGLKIQLQKLKTVYEKIAGSTIEDVKKQISNFEAQTDKDSRGFEVNEMAFVSIQSMFKRKKLKNPNFATLEDSKEWGAKNIRIWTNKQLAKIDKLLDEINTIISEIESSKTPEAIQRLFEPPKLCLYDCKTGKIIEKSQYDFLEKIQHTSSVDFLKSAIPNSIELKHSTFETSYTLCGIIAASRFPSFYSDSYIAAFAQVSILALASYFTLENSREDMRILQTSKLQHATQNNNRFIKDPLLDPTFYYKVAKEYPMFFVKAIVTSAVFFELLENSKSNNYIDKAIDIYICFFIAQIATYTSVESFQRLSSPVAQVVKEHQELQKRVRSVLDETGPQKSIDQARLLEEGTLDRNDTTDKHRDEKTVEISDKSWTQAIAEQKSPDAIEIRK
ncbi:hypothetical protein OAP83_01070 [Rickettsiales bacterium]|nr:hypothetical protein [Rickettsiales bacterium]